MYKISIKKYLLKIAYKVITYITIFIIRYNNDTLIRIVIINRFTNMRRYNIQIIRNHPKLLYLI